MFLYIIYSTHYYKLDKKDTLSGAIFEKIKMEILNLIAKISNLVPISHLPVRSVELLHVLLRDFSVQPIRNTF